MLALVMRDPMLSPELLDILACPLTKAPLVLDGDRLVSRDPQTRRSYRIDDGIPVMLIDQAAILTPEDHAAILARHGAEPWSPPTKDKVTQ